MKCTGTLVVGSRNNGRTFKLAISLTEIGMLSIAFVAIALISYALFADVSLINHKAFELSAKSSPIIATISKNKNIVKVKASTLPMWENADSTERLRSYDQVYTGKASSTKISFRDDSEIKVGENAIVVIENNRNRNSINLIKGALYGKSSAKATTMQVFVGGTKLALAKNSEFTVNRGVSKSSIVVLKGKGLLKTEKSESEISTQQVAMLSESGKIEKHELPIMLKYPAPQSDLFIARGEAIDFAWASGSEIDKYLFEISKDAEFKKTLSSFKTREPRYAMNGLKSGSYYWRVKSKGTASEKWLESAAQKISVTEELPSAPIWPEDKKAYQFPISEKRVGVVAMIDWKSRTVNKETVVEVASDINFKTIVHTERATKGPVDTPMLPSGDYAWRVKNRSHSGNWLYSEPRTFTVAAISLPSIPAPTFPLNNHAVNIDYQEKNLTQKFSWKKAKGAVNYEFQSSADDDFDEDDAITKVSSEAFAEVKFNNDGEYYWRVRSIDPYGRETEYSKPRLLSIVRLPPNAEPPPELVQTKSISVIEPDESEIAVILNWKPKNPERKRYYALQIAKDLAFSDLVDDDEVNKLGHSVELKAGKYHWRISTVTPDTDVRKWSTPQSFQVKQRPARSKISHPEAGDSIVFLAKTHPTTLAWDDVQAVNSYSVQLSNKEDFSEIIIEKRNATNEVLLDLKEGAYFARVKSHGVNAVDSDWSQPTKFDLALAPKPAVIEKLSPSGDLEFQYRKNLPKVEISFEENQDSKLYQLQLASNEAFSDSKTIDLSDTSYVLEASGEETYYRIRGVDKIGRKGGWSNTAKIAAHKLSTVPNPTAPKDNSHISGSLPEHEIEFYWDEMERVEEYTLEVATDIGFENLVSSKVTDSHSESVEFSDSGHYYWRVRAYDSNEKLAMLSNPKAIRVELEPDLVSSGIGVDEFYVEMASLPTIYNIIFKGGGPELAFSGATVESYGAEAGFSLSKVDFQLGMNQTTLTLAGSKLYEITSEDQEDLTMHFHESFARAAYLFTLNSFVMGPHIGIRQKTMPLLYRDSISTIAIQDVSQVVSEAGVSMKAPLFLGIHGGLSLSYGVSSRSKEISSSQGYCGRIFLKRGYESFFVETSYQLGFDLLNYTSTEYDVGDQLDLQTHQGKIAVGKNF